MQWCLPFPLICSLYDQWDTFWDICVRSGEHGTQPWEVADIREKILCFKTELTGQINAIVNEIKLGL